MRIFTIAGSSVEEVDRLPGAAVPGGFVWIACTRQAFEAGLATLQTTLQTLCGDTLVDLHVSDLLNPQLSSHYDYTSQYDLLVFRRLAAGLAQTDHAAPRKHSGPAILRRIDTSPVGFAVFDQVLLTVHPADCAVRDSYAHKLLAAHAAESKAAGARLPASPADLMLRIVNLMVDGFLDLRRELTRQLDHWQTALLQPQARFRNWGALLDARLTLHQLDEVCEDQRAAIQDWAEAVKTWPDAATPAEARERELLQVRGRDVLEHIERVVRHVQRLEQGVETAVQMHFNAQGNRSNDIMLTLTVLTAVFLPLNLIAGIFGMNFEFIPLVHQRAGFWWAMGSMAVIAVLLLGVFWRKRYLALNGR
jgi:Mg2+ and Co2+ transporter CorA